MNYCQTRKRKRVPTKSPKPWIVCIMPCIYMIIYTKLVSEILFHVCRHRRKVVSKHATNIQPDAINTIYLLIHQQPKQLVPFVVCSFGSEILKNQGVKKQYIPMQTYNFSKTE